MNLVDWSLLGNSSHSWMAAVVAFTVSIFILYVVRNRILTALAPLARKSHYLWVSIAIETLNHTRFFFIVVAAIFAGSQFLIFHPKVHTAIHHIFIFAFLIQFFIWGNCAIKFGFEEVLNRTPGDKSRVTTFRALSFVLRLMFYVIVLLWALDNFGINVTTFIAGLGVGGVAVALAVQNILSDLFASFSIIIDKPFVVGDFIVVGQEKGTVEHIGIKTTRLRSLSGEQLVFANNDLLKSRIYNFQRMQQRRVVFTFGVVYNTPPDTLMVIPEIVKQIVESQENTRFDRAHLYKLATSSLDFEVVYWVLNADYNIYMDINQRINLELLKTLNEMKVDFAFPTQTLVISTPNPEPDHR